MPDIARDELIAKLHAAPERAVLAVTGGGSGAIAQLLAVPGASRTVLAAVVPYAAPALAEFLGGPPEQYCTQHTARLMAVAAWERALAYAQPEPSPSGRGWSRSDRVRANPEPNTTEAESPPLPLTPALSQRERESKLRLIGLSCTASLASDRPKRGQHRIHVAWHTAGATEVTSLVLSKGARTRAEEEHVAATLILNALAAAMGLSERVASPLIDDETLDVLRQIAPPEWTALVLGESRIARGGASEPSRRAIFSGAFHPLHEGHRRIVAVGEALLGEPVALEISIHNVDKPPLDFVEIGRRIDGLEGRPVWLTSAATFVEKANLFPGATFLVGADTIARIADARYYGDNQRRMHLAIESIANSGCRFLVFGRASGERFLALADLGLPPALRAICEEVPSAKFREDVSSTEIREKSSE